MALKKKVDGVEVALTSQEAAAVQAEWDEFDPLAARREAASLDRMTFALRAAQAGFVSYDDAAGNSLPTQVQAMIDALPEAQRGPALVKVLGARNVNRNDELMPGIIAAFQTDDAGADALFGIS